jgi:SSS family solute:Na+ symporter
MVIKLIMLIAFFLIMIGVGFYCRKHANDVDGFVLGGRSVGPWLTAFAYGTSYFSAVIFVGYAGQFGWKFGLASTWIGIGNAILGSLLTTDKKFGHFLFTTSSIVIKTNDQTTRWQNS